MASVRTEAPMERYAKNSNSFQKEYTKSSWKPLGTHKQVRHKRAARQWWRQEYQTPCIAYHYQGSQNGFIKRALHTPFLLSPSTGWLSPLFLLFLSPSSFEVLALGGLLGSFSGHLWGFSGRMPNYSFPATVIWLSHGTCCMLFPLKVPPALFQRWNCRHCFANQPNPLDFFAVYSCLGDLSADRDVRPPDCIVISML